MVLNTPPMENNGLLFDSKISDSDSVHFLTSPDDIKGKLRSSVKPFESNIILKFRLDIVFRGFMRATSFLSKFGFHLLFHDVILVYLFLYFDRISNGKTVSNWNITASLSERLLTCWDNFFKM